MKHDEALSLLINSYRSDVEKMIRKHYLKGFRQIDEEDLNQLALVQMVEALQTYREERGVPFLNYYLFILKNAYINMKRSLFSYGKENDRNALSLDQQVSEENASYLSEYIPSTYHEYQADSKMVKQQFWSMIKKILDDLSEIEQQVFAMRQIGYSYKEIAETLGVSEKKVDNTLAKIRRGNYMREF